MAMRLRRVILGRVFAAFDGSGECVFFRNTMFSQDCAESRVFVVVFFYLCPLCLFRGRGGVLQVRLHLSFDRHLVFAKTWRVERVGRFLDPLSVLVSMKF